MPTICEKGQLIMKVIKMGMERTTGFSYFFILCFASLLDDWSSVPSTQVRRLIATCNSSSRDLYLLLASLSTYMHVAYFHTDTHHIKKKKRQRKVCCLLANQLAYCSVRFLHGYVFMIPLPKWCCRLWTESFYIPVDLIKIVFHIHACRLT